MILKSEEHNISKVSGVSYKKDMVFFLRQSYTIWHRVTKSSKLGLFMATAIVDLFEFSSAIAKFSFMEVRLNIRLCLQLIWRVLQNSQIY